MGKIKRSHSRKTQNGKKSSDLTENNSEIIKMKIEVELIRGSKGYGITIAGGTLHQYHPGDNGIYVTRLTEGGPAAKSGKIAVGDRLLAIKCIKNSDEINYILLENCSHETAVKAMKQCKNTAILLIEKAEDEEALEYVDEHLKNAENPPQNQQNPRKTEETSNEAFKNTTTESD